MRFAALVTSALVASALVAVTAAPAAAPLTCRSGAATYERYDFEIREAANRENDGPIFGCARGRPKPARLHFTESGITTDTGVYARFGSRQAIGFRYNADESGGSRAGWWNLRTGQVAFKELRHRGDWPADIHAIAVGDGGEIGVALEHLNEDGERDAWDVLRLPFADGKLGAQTRTPIIPLAELDPHTLAIDGTTLSWRTQGERRTATATDGEDTTDNLDFPRASRSVTCADGDTVYGDDDARIFRLRRPRSRAGLYGCRRARRARPLLMSQSAVRPRLIERRGAYVGFQQPGVGVGWFHATRGTGAVATSPARTVALAVDPRDGSLAVVRPDDSDPSKLLVGYRRTRGGDIGPEQVLATLTPAEIEVHTLATKARQVSWRVRGEPRTHTAP